MPAMHVREVVLFAVPSIAMRQAVGEAAFASLAAEARGWTMFNAIACAVASGPAR